jgi:O-antigen/teichoic acid export membrane protein
MATGADNKGVLIQEAAALHSRNLEKKAARGTLFLVGYLGVSLALRMLSNVVLARLFSPEYFGLMTLLTTVLVGLTLFSHIGLQDSVIQNPRGDEPVFLNTVWTLQAVR